MSTMVYAPRGVTRALETVAAWLLGLLWVLPLLYAFWTAFHPAEFSTRFVLTAPLTLDNFTRAWAAAPLTTCSCASAPCLLLCQLCPPMHLHLVGLPEHA